MTNEERFALLEATIACLRQEKEDLKQTLAFERIRTEDREQFFKKVVDELEGKIADLNRRLFKDTQMNDRWVTEDADTHTIKVTLPSAQAAQQAQTLQQLMQAAGIQSGTGYSNQAGINGPAPIATATGPVCPFCHSYMNMHRLSAQSTRYQCQSVNCGKVIIT